MAGKMENGGKWGTAAGKLTHLVAVNVLMMGAANIWWVPLANIIGRRPIILGYILLLVLSSMWAGLAKSFGSLLAARVFMGIAVAPADTIAPNIVSEIFFTHQQGRAVGCYTVCIALGPIIGGIVGGYIAENQGLIWIHWVNVILSAVLFIACVFLLPESLYHKEPPATPGERIMDDKPSKNHDDKNSELIENVSYPPEESLNLGQQPAQFSRLMRLYTFQGGSTFVPNFLAPWKTLRLPGVWLAMLWYAGLVGGVVTITTVGPTIVASPPYLWGKSAGLIMVGGIVGSILGFVATSLGSDRVLTTKKVLSGGQFVFAACDDRFVDFWILCSTIRSTHVVGMEFGLGVLCFDLVQAPSIGFNHIIDSYGPISADCFVAVTCMRAVISFAWTFFAGEWVTKAGAATPFGTFGALMGLFSLLVFLLWLWGKRLRIVTAKWVPAV
ncbi:major facilitator superfamily domain-containing protein [Penicillium sp. IBT 16267x]|nr:major facilitator superfamily domain-containing protein [Penicillium sp. IBT 16267x]